MNGNQRRRSALYVPASNARALEKAPRLDCDVLIIDLEDAVSPEGKTASRSAAIQALTAGAFAGREVVLRVNGLDTPWGADDLDRARAIRPAAVLAPKITCAADLARTAERLPDPSIELWAMVETCRSVLHLDEIAAAERVSTLVFGANDLLAQMGAASPPDRQPLHTAMAMTVMAARAHGLFALDGVYNRLDDLAGFGAECAQGAAFGFDGKTLIHPSQIPACHAAFSPDADAIARAHAIVDAFSRAENQGAAVLLVEGQMTERLHLARALRILAAAGATNGQHSP